MSKITQSARGESCKVRIPNVCNHNSETTIFAHINGVRYGHGIAKKVTDILGADSCSSCHDVLDGRVKSEYTKEQLNLMHFEAMAETQLRLLADGLISERR